MKKTLAVILAVLLVLSVLPVSVFATDTTVYTSEDGLYKYMILDDGTVSITTNSTSPAYLGDDTYVQIPLIIDGYRVSTVGLRAFQGTSIEVVSFPRSITKIDSYAFYNCADLTYVYLNDGLTRINYGAFLNSGINYINVPNTVTSIVTYAFKGCTNLRYARLPAAMTTVQEIFTGCTSLNTVYMHQGITSINANAFAGCTSLTAIAGYDNSYAETYAAANNYYFMEYPRFSVEAALSAGDTYAVELDPTNGVEDVYFSFTPTESGWYAFYSDYCTDDPECYLFDDEFQNEEYVYDDANDENFYFEDFYKAGKTYYFDCHEQYDINHDSSYEVTLERLEDIQSIDVYNSSIFGYEGTRQYIDYEYCPDYASYSYIDFISSDPTVAGVDENGEVYLRKAGTATITIIADTGATAYVNVTVDTIDEITLNGSEDFTFAASGEEYYLKFTPTVSGWYNFYSISDIDTYAYLLNTNFDELTENDDGGGTINSNNDYDFLIQYYYEAGTTYFFMISTYNGAEDGDATVYLAAAPDTGSITLYDSNYELFEGIPADMEYEYDADGGAVADIVSITSSDTSVIQIGSYQAGAYYEYTINPVGAGQADITIETSGGATDTLYGVTVNGAVSATENTLNNSTLLSYTSDEYTKVFRFTASQTGLYYVKVQPSIDCRLQTTVYGDFSELGSGMSDDGPYAVDCVSGYTYYVEVKMYSYGTQEADVPFTLELVPSVAASSIFFDAGSSIDVTQSSFPNGFTPTCSFVPWNAAVEGYTVTSSDSSVIYEYGGRFYVNGMGTAVLTATSTNGLTATLTVNVTTPPEIHLGDTKQVNVAFGGQLVYYTFTPDSTGYYMFTSSKNASYEKVDTYGYLYDSNMDILESDDDGSGDLDFRIVYRFIAGRTYYLCCKCYSSNVTGVFNASLKPVTGYDVDSNGEEDINDIGFVMGLAAETIDGCTDLQFALCDRNNDGVVDAFDAAKLDREFLAAELIGPNPWHKYVCAIDSNGNKYDAGDTILLTPGEKMFVYFETDSARNGAHGVTPFVGFSENDPNVATLAPQGFTITGGTGDSLGYTGITDFGFEIDATNVSVGTYAPLYMWLYEFDGTFPGSGFDFTTANVVYEDTIFFDVVDEKGWDVKNNSYIVEDAGTICEINGRTFSKTNSGKALVSTFVFDNPHNIYNWSGPILVSTDSNAVTYSTNGYDYNYIESFEYRGFTWYVSNTLDFIQGEYTFDGSLPGMYSNMVDAAKALIDAAGVYPCYV